MASDSDGSFYGGTDAPLSANQLKGGEPNVTGGERWISILAGGAMAALGARRGGVGGTLAILGGSALVARGVAGNDPVKRVFQPSPVEQRIAAERGWKTAATGGFKVAINKPIEEVFDFLHDLFNFPKFMGNLKRVEPIEGQRSRWTIDTGDGGEFSYVSHLIANERPGRFAWASEPDADFQTTGEVTLTATPRGTEAGIVIAYQPRYGQAGRVLAKLRRHEPAIDARKNMKRLKMLLETGEIPTAKINPTATNAA